mgnify:CR=1 FL=1
MTNIIGYSVYIPYYRIKLEEINAAWNRPGGRGEKTVPAPDEDVITMGLKATQWALNHARISGNQLGAVYACSVSSGYFENTVAGQIAYALGAEGNITLADYALSTRSVTAALQAGVDAIAAGRIGYALIVASDKLIAKPGSELELTSAAGAGAMVLGKEAGLARIEKIASYSSGFVGRFRVEGGFPTLDDERFVMKHGFLDHVSKAVEHLSEAIALKDVEAVRRTFDRVVLQAPDPRWGSRALAKLGLAPEKLVSTASQIGYAGCASFLIDLSAALDQVKPGEKILAISYGPGGSDAVALGVQSQQKKSTKTVTEQISQKDFVNYATYLRYNKLLRG